MIEEKFNLIEPSITALLDEASKEINKDFTALLCSVYVYHPNDEPKLGHYCIGLDVVLHNVYGDNSDNLFLEVFIEERDKRFGMDARSAWGYPRNKTIQWCFDKPVDVTEENLRIIQDKLPHMIEKFREEIRDNPNGK
jgi:hypothetical protein